MTQRLPPLKSIEAFVAVAGALSYARAAETLNITKSAVSRRIQNLETDLSVQLFRRSSKVVELTPAGAAYFKLTGPAFEALRTAGHVVAPRGNKNALRVALPQSFASSWLIPRLPSFFARHPDIDLNLDSLGYFGHLSDEGADGVHVVLRLSKGPTPGLHCEKFLSLRQFPVCSPALLKRSPIRDVSDLEAHTLLRLKSMPQAWEAWLHEAGWSEVRAARSREFDTMSLSLDAALNGLGLAMGVDLLCRSDLEAGRLAAPFQPQLSDYRAMYFTCRKSEAAARPVRRFRAWLMEEASR